MSEKAEKFFQELQKAVETDQLVLPTLPEVALKIREAVESEDSSAQQIAETLTQDAALSARMIQVANSPLYRTRNPIDDLQMAVTRLGIRMVRDLVISLAMKQIYQATSDVLDQHFRESWNTAVEVAAICRMLATTVPGINSEQALLAGLIHNIGALPILVLAEDDEELFNDMLDRNNPQWRDIMRQQYVKKYGNELAQEYAEKAKRAKYLQNRGFPLDWVFKLNSMEEYEY